MKKLIKSAEVYGTEAVVYTGSDSSPAEFINLIVHNDLRPGMGAGIYYGKGVYSVYNLNETKTEKGTYGDYIYKLKVNLYGFISFNPEVTRKIYGKELTPSQQYQKVYGKRDYIFEFLKTQESSSEYASGFSSDFAQPASEYLAGRVKGILFSGRRDGDVAVIYDASTIIPVAWKVAYEDSDFNSWRSFSKEEIKPSIGRGEAGSFERSKYQDVDVRKDREAKESIQALSAFSGDELGRREKIYIQYLIDNAPEYFLIKFFEKDWAKDYIKDAADKVFLKNSSEEFLEKFAEEKWAEDYIKFAANDLIERDPWSFLDSFRVESWARDYLYSAARSLAEKNPYIFLADFRTEPWAKDHIGYAAEAVAEEDSDRFLSEFGEEPWAKEYLNKDDDSISPDLKTSSAHSVKILKLSKALLSLGCIKDIKSLKSLI